MGGVGMDAMSDRMSMVGDALAGPSRSLFTSQLPTDVTYEELLDLVGAFGAIESVRILQPRHQAFINFVDVASASSLMSRNDIRLRGQPLELTWAHARSIPRDLYSAIRSGATRNLYTANVPTSVTEQVCCANQPRASLATGLEPVPRPVLYIRARACSVSRS